MHICVSNDQNIDTLKLIEGSTCCFLISLNFWHVIKQKMKLEQFVFRFVRMNQALVCTYLIKPAQSTFFEGFCLLVFCQVDPPQQVLTTWSKWEISVKNLSQGHNDVLLPVRESSHSQQPFPTLNHCLSPPLFFRSKHIMTVFF